MNRLPATPYYRSIPPTNLRDGFFNASLEAWVPQHLVRRIAQRVQCVLGVSRVAVLMVVQLVEEHLVDEPLAGFVLRDGVPQFFFVPAECVTDELCVLFLEKAACIPGFVDLVKVCLRVEAPAPHHLLKLPVAEREANRERVDLLPLSLAKFCVSVFHLKVLLL